MQNDRHFFPLCRKQDRKREKATKPNYSIRLKFLDDALCLKRSFYNIKELLGPFPRLADCEGRAQDLFKRKSLLIKKTGLREPSGDEENLCILGQFSSDLLGGEEVPSRSTGAQNDFFPAFFQHLFQYLEE